MVVHEETEGEGLLAGIQADRIMFRGECKLPEDAWVWQGLQVRRPECPGFHLPCRLGSETGEMPWRRNMAAGTLASFFHLCGGSGGASPCSLPSGTLCV